MQSKTFCIAPFIQLQLSANGKTGPCPYTANIWQLKKYKNIKEKWNSKELEQFREGFLSDYKNPVCNRCWRDEHSGKKSLRQRLNNFGTDCSTPDRADNLETNIFQKYRKMRGGRKTRRKKKRRNSKKGKTKRTRYNKKQSKDK